jgi:hypothetical protein
MTDAGDSQTPTGVAFTGTRHEVGDMSGLSDLTEKAKSMFTKRGGTEAAKTDAQEGKEAVQGEGSATDKAKEAGEALKDPGAEGPGR